MKHLKKIVIHIISYMFHMLCHSDNGFSIVLQMYFHVFYIAHVNLIKSDIDTFGFTTPSFTISPYKWK